MRSILRKSAAVLGALMVAGTLSSVTPAASGAAAPKAPTKVTVDWDVEEEGDAAPIRITVRSERAACERFRKVYLLNEGGGPVPRLARGVSEAEGFVQGLVVRTNARGVWRADDLGAPAGRIQVVAMPKRGCEAGFSKVIKVADSPVE